MKAKELYEKLSQLFDIESPHDDWRIKYTKYVTPAFKNGKNKEMGVMVDNAALIEKVYTATFFSEDVIDKLKKDNAKNALVFCHHAKGWDMGKLQTGGELFTEICEESYKFLKQNKISVYIVHVPMDASKAAINVNRSLSNALGLEIIEEGLYDYRGEGIGTVCKFNGTLSELQKRLEKAVGHKTFLIKNGESKIKNGMVALIGGGGNDTEMYADLVKRNINTYITGVVNAETGYPPAIEALSYAKANKINILAATHYSTEKWALIDMISYFKEIGLDAEFIPQEPKFTDYTYSNL